MYNENGMVEMALAIEGKQVVMHFQEPMQTIRFDPENLITIASRLTDMAFEARDDLKPVGDTLKAELVERHRMLLTQRFAMMLGTLRKNKNKSDGYLAQQLVDAALKEIF